jgi:class 3 adenylate cyclase
MPKMTASERARLPDSAFAYIDSRGRRRLPINDERHVRNALARFNQVSFESNASRERALKRLLAAAKKYGIVPVGFITAQLEAERRLAEKERRDGEMRARSTGIENLPTGFVTFLLTDIEGSTALLSEMGDAYGELLNDVRNIIRENVCERNGQEVDCRADEYFAVFERAADALDAALALQREIGNHPWADGRSVRVRAGIHSGRPTLTHTGYIGLSVHTAARVCSAARGGQIVISDATRKALESSIRPGIALRSLGGHRLAGLNRVQQLFEVAEEIPSDFPASRRGAKES